MSLKRLASAALAASVLAFVSGVANAAPQPAVTAGASVEAPQPAVTAGKGTVTITPPAIAATPVSAIGDGDIFISIYDQTVVTTGQIRPGTEIRLGISGYTTKPSQNFVVKDGEEVFCSRDVTIPFDGFICQKVILVTPEMIVGGEIVKEFTASAKIDGKNVESRPAVASFPLDYDGPLTGEVTTRVVSAQPVRVGDEAQVEVTLTNASGIETTWSIDEILPWEEGHPCINQPVAQSAPAGESITCVLRVLVLEKNQYLGSQHLHYGGRTSEALRPMVYFDIAEAPAPAIEVSPSDELVDGGIAVQIQNTGNVPLDNAGAIGDGQTAICSSGPFEAGEPAMCHLPVSITPADQAAGFKKVVVTGSAWYDDQEVTSQVTVRVIVPPANPEQPSIPGGKTPGAWLDRANPEQPSIPGGKTPGAWLDRPDGGLVPRSEPDFGIHRAPVGQAATTAPTPSPTQ